MSATSLISSNSNESPAHWVLEHFLAKSLAASEDTSERDLHAIQAEIDLQTDVLYVLTDKIAHRRALPFAVLVEEVQKLQVTELGAKLPSSDRISRSLHLMVKRKLVRESPSSDDNYYELAHDFLVRSVVRAYRALDRRRIAELAIFQQRRKVADAELGRLSAMGRMISWFLRILPLVTFALTLFLIYLGFDETLPDGLGLSYLWLLACPALAMLLVGVASRKASPIVLASVVLLFCGGTWLYEHSLEAVDIATIQSIEPLRSAFCTNMAGTVEQSLRTSAPPSQNPGQNALTDSCMRSSSALFESLSREGAYDFSTVGYCYDIAELFHYSMPSGDSEMRSLCQQNSSQWSGIARSTLRTGFALRPYQFNQLESVIALFAFILALAHLLLYPAVLLGTVIAKSPAAEAIRRVWAEVFDVTLILLVVLGVAAGGNRLSPDYSGRGKFEILGLIGGTILCFAVFVILLKKQSATPGMLLAKLRVSHAAGGSLPLGGLVLRQSVLTFWAFLNIFLGIPSLVITPLYIWLRRNHQLFYYSWFKLRTSPVSQPPEPAAPLSNSVAGTSIQGAMSAP